ncbi:MAG: hypothetical protein NTY47_05840, partial [Candidatus Omnitrophica bacterium]|nr:hypothetical protein [Candidatus Omnitrophota bacterium]
RMLKETGTAYVGQAQARQVYDGLCDQFQEYVTRPIAEPTRIAFGSHPMYCFSLPCGTNMYVLAYEVGADRWYSLFNPGPANLFDQVEAALRNNGIQPERIQRIYVTNYDPMYAGAAVLFKEKYPAIDVCVHPAYEDAVACRVPEQRSYRLATQIVFGLSGSPYPMPYHVQAIDCSKPRQMAIAGQEFTRVNDANFVGLSIDILASNSVTPDTLYFYCRQKNNSFLIMAPSFGQQERLVEEQIGPAARLWRSINLLYGPTEVSSEENLTKDKQAFAQLENWHIFPGQGRNYFYNEKEVVSKFRIAAWSLPLLFMLGAYLFMRQKGWVGYIVDPESWDLPYIGQFMLFTIIASVGVFIYLCIKGAFYLVWKIKAGKEKKESFGIEEFLDYSFTSHLIMGIGGALTLAVILLTTHFIPDNPVLVQALGCGFTFYFLDRVLQCMMHTPKRSISYDLFRSAAVIILGICFGMAFISESQLVLQTFRPPEDAFTQAAPSLRPVVGVFWAAILGLASILFYYSWLPSGRKAEIWPQRNRSY